MINSASKNVAGNIAAGERQGDGLAECECQGNGSVSGGQNEDCSTSGGRQADGSAAGGRQGGSSAPAERRREFRLGLRRSIPVALGYFAVAFTFGIFCTKNGLPPLAAALLSLTNLSSTGQFVGVEIFGRLGSLFEMGLAVLVVNLRYLLMSFALTQRLDPRVGIGQRLFLAWGVTDEIFALGLLERPLTFAYYAGLMPLPILGWTSGTLLGALLGQVLPASIQSAFGIALYAMFIAIVVPPTKSSRPLQIIVALAALFGVLLAFLPGTRELDLGWRIIIVGVAVSAIGATLFPVDMDEAGTGDGADSDVGVDGGAGDDNVAGKAAGSAESGSDGVANTADGLAEVRK